MWYHVLPLLGLKLPKQEWKNQAPILIRPRRTRIDVFPIVFCCPEPRPQFYLILVKNKEKLFEYMLRDKKIRIRNNYGKKLEQK